MFELKKIDLGKDEAEQDARLAEYFLKTPTYNSAFDGRKTIIIGRKGSGKSAIFTLLRKELEKSGTSVISITPDQYSWSALKDYKEQGILPIQASTNAWKLTLLAAVVWKLNENGVIPDNSKLTNYYHYMRDSFIPEKDNWFGNIVQKAKNFLAGIKTEWITLDWGQTAIIATPLRITEDLKYLLKKEWPKSQTVRILIDRVDDSWDGSEESKDMIIGLLKAANEINASFEGKIIITVFIRSDIYDNLYFDDQDKLRQYEDVIIWNTEALKSVISERVRVSLQLKESNYDTIWKELFSEKTYRSRASAEKYIIDRTFKRPRDIISFVRLTIEKAIENGHPKIEPQDTQSAEEMTYSLSKYKDLIIEYQKQVPYIQSLLDSFTDLRHKVSKNELKEHLEKFITKHKLEISPIQLLKNLFLWGVIGVKKQGRYGINQRGGAHFFYYFDDPSIDPLRYSDFYFHPALRYCLHISEKRENREKKEEMK